VGSRTTMRFINTQHIPWFEGNEVRLQQLQSKTGLFRYLQHKKEHPEARLHAFDTDFTKYVSRNIVNLPTGGYFAVRPLPAWDTATKTSRIVTSGGLARRDRKWSLNDGQIPNPNVVRVASGTGYHRVEGNRRASRNGPVAISTRNP
jgi:hypothetical protein